MRLRLVHALFLLLLAVVLTSVLAMGAFTAWNLRQGFADYLVARDVERLERFAQMLEEKLAAGARVEDWRGPPHALRALLEEFSDRPGGAGESDDASPDGRHGRHGRRRFDAREGPPDRAPRGAAEDALRFDGRPGDGPPGDGPPGDGPPEAGPPRLGPPGAGPRPGARDNFGPRLSLLDASQAHLSGWPTTATQAAATRPLVVGGATLGYLRLRRGPPVPDEVDARFLQRQYLGLLGVAAALLAVVLAASWWIARRWARPLLEVQQASARIARGEFAVRLEERGSAEIADTVRNINAMAASLSRLEGARRRWLADVSHELRTPLTVLRGEVEALADGVRAPTPAAIGSLREETLRLARLVDDLHLVAVADLDALRCDFVDADAGELVRAALRRFEGQARERGIALEPDLPEGALPVAWDVARIDQLCANLLENALRYTDAPGRIRVRLRRDGETLHLSVDDTPPGVAPEHLESLFEPLYRTDAARARTRGGSGLGLAICAALARAHGGRIATRPSDLGGLGIDVSLPARPGLAP